MVVEVVFGVSAELATDFHVPEKQVFRFRVGAVIWRRCGHAIQLASKLTISIRFVLSVVSASSLPPAMTSLLRCCDEFENILCKTLIEFSFLGVRRHRCHR